MTGLTYKGFTDGFQYFAGQDGFKYETFPDYLKSKGLGEDMESTIPLWTDALPIWQAYHDFFAAYVSLFYTGDDEVNIVNIVSRYFFKQMCYNIFKIDSDPELRDFWQCIDTRGNFGSPWRVSLLTLLPGNANGKYFSVWKGARSTKADQRLLG